VGSPGSPGPSSLPYDIPSAAGHHSADKTRVRQISESSKSPVSKVMDMFRSRSQSMSNDDKRKTKNQSIVLAANHQGPGAEEKEKRPRHVVNELFKSFAHGSKTTESLPSTVSTRYRDRSLSVGGVPACRGKPDISCQAVYSIYDGILKEGNGGIFLSSKKTKAFEILKHPRFL